MKIFHHLVGVAVAGLLTGGVLSGCAHSREGSEQIIGPVFFGGFTYYPAKPGRTYKNTPVDYTTNPPPAGTINYVTVISTNGIVVHLMDGTNAPSTQTLPR